MVFRKFIKLSLLLSSIIPLSIFLFNYIIDPFNWNGTNILNLYKPHLSYDRYSKIGMADIEDFDIVVISMSTSQKINPKLIEQYTKKIAYNFSMTGSTPYEQKILLEYILKKHKLDTVIIVVNEFSYHTALPSMLTRDFPIDKYKDNFPFYLKYYFRPMMVRQSLKTILFNFTKQKSGYGLLEYHGMEDWELERKDQVNKNRIKEINKSIQNLQKTHPNSKGFYDENLVNFKEMIDLCIRDNVKNIIVYFPPQYAEKLRYQKEKMSQYYESMLKFKKDIIQTTKAECKKYRCKSNIKIYDFIFENNITNNPMYFWDFKHAKNKLDNMIIKNIYDNCKNEICIRLY